MGGGPFAGGESRGCGCGSAVLNLSVDCVNDYNLATRFDHANIFGHSHSCVVVVSSDHQRPQTIFAWHTHVNALWNPVFCTNNFLCFHRSKSGQTAGNMGHACKLSVHYTRSQDCSQGSALDCSQVHSSVMCCAVHKSFSI